MSRRLLLAACLSSLLRPSLAAAPPLRIVAASSLTEVLGLLARRFEAAHPGTRLHLEFAASGLLVQRIARGEVFDLLLTADERSMRDAGAQLRAGSAQVFAGNALVLVVPAVGEAVNAPADLLRLRSVAIGRPTSVPVGRYAQQALQSFGLWEPLQGRLREAADARQVLDWVLGGEAEAGLVFRSDASRHLGALRVVSELGGHEPIRYLVGVLANSPQPALAAQFSAFLRGAEARAILRRGGFSVGHS